MTKNGETVDLQAIGEAACRRVMRGLPRSIRFVLVVFHGDMGRGYQARVEASGSSVESVAALKAALSSYDTSTEVDPSKLS